MFRHLLYGVGFGIDPADVPASRRRRFAIGVTVIEKNDGSAVNSRLLLDCLVGARVGLGYAYQVTGDPILQPTQRHVATVQMHHRTPVPLVGIRKAGGGEPGGGDPFEQTLDPSVRFDYPCIQQIARLRPRTVFDGFMYTVDHLRFADLTELKQPAKFKDQITDPAISAKGGGKLRCARSLKCLGP